MGAAYCTGRKDDSILEQSLASLAYGSPAPIMPMPRSSRNNWDSAEDEEELEDGSERIHPSGSDDAAWGGEIDLLDLRIAALLAAYSSEVRDGHGLLTAADSYYFTLLEFQRRHDSVGIQAEAVRQILEREPEVTSGACCWRERLAEKRSEALEALASRAKHYAVGKRSSRGLLQITSGEVAETTLRGYEALLDKEYEIAAHEIEATLNALSEQPESKRKDHAKSLLEQLRRSATFWTSQIEETFDVWQAASMKLNQAQVKRNGAWGELMPAVRALLSELQFCKKRGMQIESGFAAHASPTAVASRTQCCTRLLELDMHQYAHGLTSVPRRQLLNELLASAREDNALPSLGRCLLHDTNFNALQDVQIGDSGHCVLDVQSVTDHPWASVLAEIFGELICAVSEASDMLHASWMPAKKVVALRAIEQVLVRQPGLEEVRRVAAVYSRLGSGVTPLHQAARAHSSWLCGRLLELQANPLMCDSSGVSPLSIAEEDEYCPQALLESLRNSAKQWQQAKDDSEGKPDKDMNVTAKLEAPHRECPHFQQR